MSEPQGKEKDELAQAIDGMHRNFTQSAEASCGDVTVLWTGIRGEENLLVYNHRTRQILYHEAPPIGMDADYDVVEAAKEFSEGTFVSDGNCLCTHHPAGRYGPNGLISR